MSDNLLHNGDFEADWSEEQSHRCLIFHTDGQAEEAERGNIFTPPGWVTWYRHGTPVEHDPNNNVGWSQPEVRDARNRDPDRMHSGEKGTLLFTFHRIHDAGFLQQVGVTPGTRVRLSAWAHAWSNLHGTPNTDNPRWSDGAGVGTNHFFGLEGKVKDDGTRNFTFWLGIDPTGEADPWAQTAIWGYGAHIYNGYRPVPPVEVVAEADTVTVFLRSKTLWPFKHNDAYWDDVILEAVAPRDLGDPNRWTVSDIHAGWQASTSTPTNEDVFDLWRWQVIRTIFNRERTLLENKPADKIDPQEREAKLACLNDLEAQFRRAYLDSLPKVTYTEMP